MFLYGILKETLYYTFKKTNNYKRYLIDHPEARGDGNPFSGVNPTVDVYNRFITSTVYLRIGFEFSRMLLNMLESIVRTHTIAIADSYK